jgi:putative aminopeptidase FrvX
VTHREITSEARLNRALLQELLSAYGPVGQEDAVRDICRRELEPLVDDAWIDEAGNLVGVVHGTGEDDDVGPIRVMAHLDELSMLVKRVEPDGSLHLTQLGTMYPGNFGLGPVAVLGNHQMVPGVLTLGSEHTTEESQRIWETKPDKGDKSLDWNHVYVFTGRTTEELTAAGVRPGTRVCVDQSKRILFEVGKFLGSYFMDDRACLAAMLETARLLHQGDVRPARDVYFVCTVSEEIGGIGGTYASRTLAGEITVALEVGPTEQEYSTSVTGGPIIAYSDQQSIYDKSVADRLMDIATELGLAPQAAVLGAFESDASHSVSAGQTARAGLLCLPTLSTHGYEVVADDAIPAMSEVLLTFLLDTRIPGSRR